MEIILDSENVRYLIDHAHEIKKKGRCTHCNETGWINWDAENGGDTKPGTNYEDSTRDNDECEECQGVGFVWWLE